MNTRIMLMLGLLAILFASASAEDTPASAVQSADVQSQGAGQSGTSSARSADNFLFTGSMLYSVPIEVPPGVMGLQPSLALQYNSSAGNGVAGVGWTLSLGAIQRSTKSGVPKYDSSDSFVATLQGATHELTKVAPEKYRIKIEDAYMNFVSNGNWWVVTDKSGTKYYFGLNAANRVAGPSGTYQWMLDKVEDRNGNFMTVTYASVAGENLLFPSEILYTGNANAARMPDRKVIFTFAPRADVLTSYQSGFPIRTSKRLSEIITQVFVNGQWKNAARYNLTYAVRAFTNRSLLQKVEVTGFGETGTQTQMLASFTYPPEARGWEEKTSEWGTPKWSNTGTNLWLSTFAEFIDINSDGRQDYAVSYDRPSAGGPVKETWLNNGNTWIPGGHAWILPEYLVSADYFQFAGAQFADFNGDGRPDLAAATYSVAPHTWINTGKGWAENGSLALPHFLVTREGKTIGARIADINGDRRADLLVSIGSRTGDARGAYINNGNGWIETPAWRLPAGSSYNFSDGDFWIDSGAQLIDLNGDSRVDFVYGNYGSRKTLINTGSGWRDDPAWALPDEISTSLGYNRGCRLIDVNGDNLPDFVKSQSFGSSSDVKTYINTGRGWEEEPNWRLPLYLAFQHSGNLWTQTWATFSDVNGDGLPDFVYSYTDNTYGTLRKTFLNTGSGWAECPDWALPTYLGVNTGLSNGARVVDLNSDLSADFAVNYGQVHDHVRNSWVSKSPASNDLISKINSASGGETQITYDKSTNYPNTFLPYPMWVVKTIKQVDGRPETIDPVTTYNYSGGLFDVVEKEFLGFADVTTTDPDGNISSTTFHQNLNAAGAIAPENALKGRVKSVKQFNASNTLLKSVETTWTYESPTSAVYSVRMSSIKNIDHTTSPALVTLVENTYDGYGNLTKSKNHGDVAVSGDEQTQNITYAVDNAGVLMGLPCRIQVGNFSSPTLTDTRFFYDDSSSLCSVSAGNATEIRRWIDAPLEKWVSAFSKYNSLGQVTSITDAKGNVSITSYDSFGFPAVSTNPLGHTVRSTYDPLTGNILSVTDPNNQSTRYKYDAFGRPIKIIGPLDSDAYPTESTDYHDDLLGDPLAQYTEKFTRVVRSSSTVLWSRSYFDGLGRAYKAETQGAAGNSVLQETLFNNRGMASHVSLPRFGSPSTNPVWTQTMYDALGRVTHVIAPDNTATYSAYQGRVTYVTDANGKTQSSINDAHGRVIMRHEPSVANPTLYEYDTLGNLVKLTNSQGKSTTFTYDSLGRKLSMIDPNAGAWQYTYDDNGNLARQTDARGVVIGFDYDALNRVTRKYLVADSSGVTGQSIGTDLGTYVYDSTSPYSIGRLSASSFGRGSGGTTYSYNEIGQVTATHQTIGDKTYTVLRDYDALGRLTQIKYPSDRVIKYTYDDGNHLSNITGAAPGSEYATFSSFDAYGRALQMSQAGALFKTTYGFDPLKGTLTSLKTENTIARSSQTFQHFSYTFDRVGNLSQITNLLYPARSQTFIYDDLNRLTRATGEYGVENYAYDNLGNFARKGKMSYVYGDFDHPDAVKEITGTGALGTDDSTLISWDSRSPEQITSSYTVRNLVPLYQDRFSIGAFGGLVSTGANNLWHMSGFDPPRDNQDRASMLVLANSHTLPSNALTVMFWTKPVTLPKKSPVPLLAKSTTSASGKITDGFQVSLSTAGKVLFEICAASGVVKLTSNASIEKNKLTFICATFDGARMKIYLNGIERGSVASTITMNDNEHPLSIAGSVDELRIHSRAWSQAEILAALREFQNVSSYTYDATGNRLTKTTGMHEWNYKYDAEGRLVEVKKDGGLAARYTYNENGERIKKVVGSTATETTIYIGKLFEKRSDGSIIDHVFGGSQVVCDLVQSSSGTQSAQYYQVDHLGSVSLVMDPAGGKTQEITYKPFGETFTVDGQSINNLGYTGQEADAETENSFYNARYYDPAMGRFISPDSIVPSAMDPQSLNRYSYVQNNPVIFTDPTGHLSFKLKNFLGAAVPFLGPLSFSIHSWSASKTWEHNKHAVANGAIAWVTSGFNPLVGAAAFATTEFMDSRGGKHLTGELAKILDKNGMGTRDARFWSEQIIYAAVSMGIESTVASMNGQVVSKSQFDAAKDSNLLQNGGGSNLGRTPADIYNNTPNNKDITRSLITLESDSGSRAIVAAAPVNNLRAFETVGVIHTSAVTSTINGTRSMSGWSYLYRGTCQQYTNTSLLQSGFGAITTGALGVGWSAYATNAIYGTYSGQVWSKIYLWRTNHD